MTLPKHPDELCFSTDVFLEEGFTVDEFVNQCRKRVTIECLRDDLDAYYRTLKSAMVELINKDYADFVNLSANLVGVDKSIDGLVTPLVQLKEEVSSIKEAMDTAISATETKLTQRAEIRAKKGMLKRLMVVMESLESLERLLDIRQKPHPLSPSTGSDVRSEIEQLAEREEFAAIVLERVTSEFNRLQFNVSHTQDHPLVNDITPRIAVVTRSLQSRLELQFQEALDKRDRERLCNCLQAYASIGRQEDAENMFQVSVVHLFLDKVVHTKSLVSGGGLSAIYSQILSFFPKQCSLLVDLTHPRPSVASKSDGGNRGSALQPPRVPGFEFLVNAVWPEVVVMVDERISAIFAPGNPANFHKNYTVTMEFVTSFEGLCPTQASVRRLRAHPSFTHFLSKWSLPIYFQIRFQEIAGSMENSLSLTPAPDKGTSAHDGPPPFKLEMFLVLWDCLHRCWSSDIYLHPLSHRFWKLTLQLIIRTAQWLTELHTKTINSSSEITTSFSSASSTAAAPSSSSGSRDSSRTSLTVAQNLHLIHDCQLFIIQVKSFFAATVAPKLSIERSMKSPSILQECVDEVVERIERLVPLSAENITSQVTQTCCKNLEPAHTIPRLYRRTNREVPQGASSYVGSILRPLVTLRGEVPANFEKQWTSTIVERVTKRFYEITSEVLTSVKRTEDSLMKLRRNRQSLLPASGMSDDNKIRLQIALDIETYCSKVQNLGDTVYSSSSPSSSSSLNQLVETGRAAKTLALTASSTTLSTS